MGNILDQIVLGSGKLYLSNEEYISEILDIKSGARFINYLEMGFNNKYVTKLYCGISNEIQINDVLQLIDECNEIQFNHNDTLFLKIKYSDIEIEIEDEYVIVIKSEENIKITEK